MFGGRQTTLARLTASFGQQRKLFLLVFLWTCLCILVFKSTLFSRHAGQQRAPDMFLLDEDPPTPKARTAGRLEPFAQSPTAGWLKASSASPLYLAPEFALPDNSNSQALVYSLSSLSAPSSSPVSPLQVPANSARDRATEIDRAHSPDSVKVQPQPQPQQNKQATKAANQQSQHTPQPASQSSSAASLPQQLQQQQQPHEAHQNPKQELNANEFVVGAECKYKYPNLFDLQFNNIQWQKMTTKPNMRQPNSTTSANYYLYNAYYDDRWRAGTPSVRILAMIDRIHPPPTNCLLWSTRLASDQKSPPVSLVTRASFVYAWYPKWGNYKDGILQPWIVTCPVPKSHVGLVPDSVSLVEVPPEIELDDEKRRKRQITDGAQVASIAMPAAYSSSSAPQARSSLPTSSQLMSIDSTRAMPTIEHDCKATLPITNNLPVMNHRPAVKERFAVCVKGLDFPHEDLSTRLVEWIELLNLLGASKIFLYVLDVHENISKVLQYYQKRGIVELSPLTLPGDQPNLPEYQHLYLKSKLTTKRQNELIPYNDCLYRNLNSYQYLALLDIDEIIMPLKHHNWFGLMDEVERVSLSEQNYTRASYNVRNVYFFDDLAGPLGTTSSSPPSDGDDSAGLSGAVSGGADIGSHEHGIPHYLHMMQHVYRSKNYTKPGQYVKCFHNTERVVSLHNHFPMNCFGQCTTYSIPVELSHLQHYRKDCVGPLKQSCKSDFRVFTTRDTTIWKYKQQMIRRTTRVLNHLGLLGAPKASDKSGPE